MFHFGKSGYPPPLFSYEWQTKELQEREFVRVANKGLAGRSFHRREHPDQIGAGAAPRDGKKKGQGGIRGKIAVGTERLARVKADYHEA